MKAKKKIEKISKVISNFFGAILMFISKYIIIRPINFINRVFDFPLKSYKEEYEKTVFGILPETEDIDEIKKQYHEFIEQYYNHKKTRRNTFVFFLVTIPTYFTAIFWLQSKLEYYFAEKMILFSLFMAWITVHMLSIAKRKVWKKSRQLIEYESNYSYLANTFTVTKKVNYNNSIWDKYLSSTNLYRATVVIVFIALIILLFENNSLLR